MAADDLALQGANVTKSRILIHLSWNIPASALEGPVAAYIDLNCAIREAIEVIMMLCVSTPLPFHKSYYSLDEPSGESPVLMVTFEKTACMYEKGYTAGHMSLSFSNIDTKLLKCFFIVQK